MKKQTLLLFLACLGLLQPLSFAAAGTVLSTHAYAWSNNVGYINFGDVTVNNSQLEGTAWSETKGFILFHPTNGGVLNDGHGHLSGSAWGEQLGWINFDQVTITSAGVFTGTADGPLVGTITFTCPTFCDVQTDWRAGQPDTVGIVPTRPVITVPSGSTTIPVITNTPTEASPLFDVTSEPTVQAKTNFTLFVVLSIVIELLALLILIYSISRIRRARARAKIQKKMVADQTPDIKP